MSVGDPAIGQAWIDVLAPAHDRQSLLSSLRRGAFVASTGAAFVNLSADGTTITVEATAGSSLRFIGRGGRLLRTCSSNLGSYRANGDKGYVRVEAIRDHGARACIQPCSIACR